MREVLTISVPKEFATQIRKAAKKRGMAISHYIIHSVKIQDQIISEEDILNMGIDLKKDIKAGKALEGLNTLKSLYES